MSDQAPPFHHRRDAILEAALSAFLELGYRGTNLATIRARSGASTGSIYHFFSGKGALASALFDRAVARWGAEAGAEAADPAAPAERAITASVAGLMRFAFACPAEARFLDEIRSLAAPGNELAAIDARLAQGQIAASRRYAHYVARGEVRPLPWPIAHALMLGPAYDLLRTLPDPRLPPETPELVAAAAWTAVAAP